MPSTYRWNGLDQHKSPLVYNGIVVPSFDKRALVVPVHQMSRESLESHQHKPLANAFVPVLPAEKPQLSQDALLREMQTHCNICRYTYKNPVMQIHDRDVTKRCNTTVMNLWYD